MHLDCKTLFCFVYDPEKRLANSEGIADDLSFQEKGLDVIVFVAPKQ